MEVNDKIGNSTKSEDEEWHEFCSNYFKWILSNAVYPVLQF